jgi:glycosyltransferase involved in cell wall biosynthesis
MKVLFAIAHLGKGGGQAVQCAQLVRRLAPRVEGELLVLRTPGGMGDALGVEATEVGDLRFPRGVSQMRRAIADRRSRFDVFQALDPFYSLPAARLARVHPLAVRMGAHPVDDLASRFGSPARFAAQVVNPWLYSGTTVVVNAPHLAPEFPSPDVRYIPNGVDLARFPEPADRDEARREMRLPSGVPIAGFTGKLIPRKNIEDLYWLARAVPGLHVALAGTDHEPYYGDGYHRSVRSEFPDVLDRVHAIGELPAARVPGFLAAIDVFVFPSRLEGMPNSLLEAMAAGLPVVASDAPAHRALLADGTGALYSDRAALRGKVEELLADPRAAAAVGRRAREFVAAHFGFDAAVAAYLDLYRQMLHAAA